eukprot:6973570-Ditylum_brightwellii.AAC.2
MNSLLEKLPTFGWGPYWVEVPNGVTPWEFHWDLLGSSRRYLGVSHLRGVASVRKQMLHMMCWEKTAVAWVV